MFSWLVTHTWFYISCENFSSIGAKLVEITGGGIHPPIHCPSEKSPYTVGLKVHAKFQKNSKVQFLRKVRTDDRGWITRSNSLLRQGTKKPFLAHIFWWICSTFPKFRQNMLVISAQYKLSIFDLAKSLVWEPRGILGLNRALGTQKWHRNFQKILPQNSFLNFHFKIHCRIWRSIVNHIFTVSPFWSILGGWDLEIFTWNFLQKLFPINSFLPHPTDSQTERGTTHARLVKYKNSNTAIWIQFKFFIH